MINTVGLLLQLDEEFKLSTHICVEDIVQHWKYLRSHGAYFPYLELLPDERLKAEFCPARVLYPNNLYETSPNDLLNVMTDLTAYLKRAFIHTCPAILLYAHAYRIDYAKVCYIPFDSHNCCRTYRRYIKAVITSKRSRFTRKTDTWLPVL